MAAREPLAAAAKKTADWLTATQTMYHMLVQGWPNETRDTCDAGMCGDYREHRDLLEGALRDTAAPETIK
jgi:hypothetical protein